MAVSLPTANTTSPRAGAGLAICSRRRPSHSTLQWRNSVRLGSVSYCGNKTGRFLGRRHCAAAREGRGRSVIVCAAAFKKMEEVEALEMSNEKMEFPAAPGVYAVFDKEGKMQFVGISRRVLASLQNHLQDVPELCGSAKVVVVDAPDKTALTSAWQQWVQEHVDGTGEPPPGNASGVTTWTARKPRSSKPELKMTPGPNTKLTIPLTKLIDKVVKTTPVVAFIKGTRVAPQCGFSHQVLTILNENRVDYEVVNVLDDHFNSGLRDAIKEYSKWPTIPQLYVKGEFVGGADILIELVESGEITDLFKK